MPWLASTLASVTGWAVMRTAGGPSSGSTSTANLLHIEAVESTGGVTLVFVVSDGNVRSLDRPGAPPPYWLRLSDDYAADYAAVWRTQPAVRTVVSFLARNIASLGLHTFQRVSDTDRERLSDHRLAQLFAAPNPATTKYRLLNALVHDLGIYDAAFWLKLNTGGGSAQAARRALVRLPPERTRPTGSNWMWPEAFEVFGSRGRREFPADQVVYFRGYNPDDQLAGCSPLEALRRVLAEEFEAGRMREQVLRNGARISGYLERPAEAPKWSPGGKDRFRADWQAQYAGSGPQAGGTPILEDGMVFHPAAQTAEQLQYVESRKLTREEVAAAYFIPPPMIGILDHATFSNITEQHKMLYQDTLGPWLDMICAEIGLQLVGDFEDPAKVYVEFNLAEKLRGSFEEQAQQLQSSVGAPWLTRNEARARMNLSAIEGGDELVTPLNVLVGGQASPRDSAPEPDEASARAAGRGKAASAVLVKARAPETYETQHERVLKRFFGRQAASVRSRLGAKAAAKADVAADGDWWEQERWDRELAADLYRLAIQLSKDVAATVLESIGFGPDAYDTDRTLAFLLAMAERMAASINATTKTQLDAALAEDDPAQAIADVFTTAESSRAAQIAVTTVTAMSGFATVEAARQVAGDAATKTWITGPRPRPSHAAMNGETVAIDEHFSSGQLWPGDPTGDASDTAGCNCSVAVSAA